MSRRRLAWFAWATVCIVWGTTYLAIKIALETVPPFLMGGLRYIAGGLILAAIVVLRGHRLPPVGEWHRLAVLGFFMMVLGNGGVVWAEQHVPTGLAAVLIGTTPFWMVSVDAAVSRGRQLFPRQWIGLVIGFAGIMMLVWPDITAGGTGGRGFAMGVLSLQCACCGWAIGAAYTRRQVVQRDILSSAAMQMIFGGLFMLLIGTAMGEWSHLTFNTRTIAALSYLTVAGAVIGFGSFSYALQYLDVAIVSLYTYINPVIAVALGTLVLDEPFHLRMIAAAVVIVLGILVVGRPSPGK